MFRLVNQRNGNAVYAGIREFSADDGEVALSSYLMEALGIQEEDLQLTKPKTNGNVIDLTGDDEDVVMEDDNRLKITVKASQPPKGTYVRLRPLEAGYNPDDWKSLLERQLRASYTTLTKDSMLSVRGVKSEEFRFLVDKFRPEGDGICVVDTDLEVDIEALNEEQARETMRQIAARSQRAPGTAAGSSVGHTIDIWKDVDGQVLEGDYVDYDLPSWDRSRSLVIELSGIEDGDEVDLFVSPKSSRQRALPRDSEHVFGDFSSPKSGTKTIIIQPTNVELEGAESLLVAIHGYRLPEEEDDTSSKQPPRKYKLRARAQKGSSDDTAVEHSPEEEQCKNCRQWVPKRTMMLHENFCLRNNILCPSCQQVFQKNSAEWKAHWHCPDHADASGNTELSHAKHQDVFHGTHICSWCGPSFTFSSLALLAQHRTSVCPGKLILCQFCHLEVPQEGDAADPSAVAETVLTGLTAHERADGGRTTDCHLCGAIVRLRDLPAHLANHDLDKAARPRPPICRNALCCRTLHGAGARGRVGLGQGAGNPLGLCSLCFTPLYASVHDPDNKALRRRVERRYLTQLMKGCGKKTCRNEWCRTGRANQGLEDWGGAAAEALKRAKPLVDEAMISDAEGRGAPMYFCVDETTQKRRAMADMLAAEDHVPGGGGWDLEWCVAAMEAEGGDLARARTWLTDWAPRRKS
jgi:hypothetical protein